jgi:hypothetical protein
VPNAPTIETQSTLKAVIPSGDPMGRNVQCVTTDPISWARFRRNNYSIGTQGQRDNAGIQVCLFVAKLVAKLRFWVLPDFVNPMGRHCPGGSITRGYWMADLRRGGVVRRRGLQGARPGWAPPWHISEGLLGWGVGPPLVTLPAPSIAPACVIRASIPISCHGDGAIPSHPPRMIRLKCRTPRCAHMLPSPAAPPAASSCISLPSLGLESRAHITRGMMQNQPDSSRFTLRPFSRAHILRSHPLTFPLPLTSNARHPLPLRPAR